MKILHIISIIYLIIGIISFGYILFDIFVKKHFQSMSIMNIVWPITGLYLGFGAVILYRKWTLSKPMMKMSSSEMHMSSMHNPMKMESANINFRAIAQSTMHCGSGCTIGDAISEPLLFFFPIIILQNTMYNKWLIQFIFAFVIGIFFQYLAIRQMNPQLSFSTIIQKALKADTLSLIFWQIGMYGGMAIAQTLLPKDVLNPTTTIYWFVMQLAMILGFCTAYPINYWLLKKGIKEPM